MTNEKERLLESRENKYAEISNMKKMEKNKESMIKFLDAQEIIRDSLKKQMKNINVFKSSLRFAPGYEWTKNRENFLKSPHWKPGYDWKILRDKAIMSYYNTQKIALLDVWNVGSEIIRKAVSINNFQGFGESEEDADFVWGWVRNTNEETREAIESIKEVYIILKEKNKVYIMFDLINSVLTPNKWIADTVSLMSILLKFILLNLEKEITNE